MKKSKFNQTTGLLAALAAGSLVVGCSNSGSSSSGGGTPAPVVTAASPITIDNAGTVPIIGDNATSSVIYVHNNSKQAISGISYKAILNTGSEKFIDAKSAALCATIPAGQSCPLAFTTPAVSKTVAQGSAMVSASYSYEKEPRQFSQLISFIRVDSKVAKGAQFNSGVMLNGVGNDSVYGTVYLYGSGQSQIYDVNSITSSNPGVKIIQGNITGKQLSSNYVSALEVSAPSSMLKATEVKSAKTAKSLKSSLKADPSYYATLTAVSTLGSMTYSSTSDIGVSPTTDGAYLTAGNVPIIDTMSSTKTGTLLITNAGNAAAANINTSSSGGVVIDTNNCSTEIAAHTGCTIEFSVPQAGGEATITITQGNPTAQTLVANIVWYNSTNEALLQMTSSQDPISFNATEGKETTITVTNIGGFDLTNMATVNPVVSDGGTGAITSNSPRISCEDGSNAHNPTGTDLPIDGTCTYTASVNNLADISGTATFSISGDYTGTNSTLVSYARKLAVPYTSNAYRATLTIDPATIAMPAIYGDGVDEKYATAVVTNSGTAPATGVSAGVLSANPDLPSYLTVVDNGPTTCGTVTELNANETCTVKLKIGPWATDSDITGTALLTVNYTGAGQVEGPLTATSNVTYTVLPNSQNLELTNVAKSANITGTGASGVNAYQIAGYTTGNSITLTYTNTGTNDIKISGINNFASPIAWSMSGTCYNNGNFAGASALAPGGTCTIIFTNVLATYAAAVPGGLPATFDESIEVPEIMFYDTEAASGSQFLVQPEAPAPISGPTIYATGNQATLVNEVVNPGNGIVTIKHTLANAANYPALTVTSKMEDYFSTTTAPTLDGCTVNAENGVMTQTCTLTPSSGTAQASVAYTNNSAYTGDTLHVLFKLTTGGEVVSFTPLSTTVTMP